MRQDATLTTRDTTRAKKGSKQILIYDIPSVDPMSSTCPLVRDFFLSFFLNIRQQHAFPQKSGSK